MTPEKWNKVKEIFNQAVELSNGERGKFLDETINGDSELRVEVEKLLAADENAETLFDGKNLIAPEAFSASEQIGNYRIVRKIGEGGMGAVFLAERLDTRQRVALKIIRRSAVSEIILRRFRREQEILASLEHPNIARLLDVGIGADGTPFLAMEYVEGRDLSEFCRDENLSVAERLKLFRKICAAVAYAHSRLIVHRDLKPSNIVVNESGEPKLLDFGISKLLSESEFAEDKGTVTSFGMLTPNYASPEQFRGETVSTATDVYSLGVILYEMLTERLPYDVSSRRLDEVARIVLDTNPPKPSEASGIWQTAKNETNAEARTTNSEQKSKTKNQKTKTKFANPKVLRGDLDNIILKALRKEPSRRYSSIEKFSDDVRRHLEGLPVAARPDTFAYRAEKFIARHRLAMAAGLIIVLSLLGGVAATTWQAIRAERQRALAEKRLGEVRRLANKVVFTYNEEIEKIPGTTKVQEMMITDAIDYLDHLAQDAADDVSLKRELAKSYTYIAGLQGGLHTSSGIGAIADAIESDRKAVALLEDAAQKSDDSKILEELRTAYSDLGQIYMRAGDERKTEFLQKAIDLSERLSQAEPENAERKIRLANDYINLGDTLADDSTAKTEIYFGDKKLYLRGLEIIETVLLKEPENFRVIDKKMLATSRLSAIYQVAAEDYKQRGDNARAREFAEQALNYIGQARECVAQLNRIEPDAADWEFTASQLRWNESLIHSIFGDDETALKMQNEEIGKIENAAAADANNAELQSNLAVCYDGYSTTFSNLKKYDSAFEYQRKALAIINRLIEQDEENLEFRQTRRDIVNHAGDFLQQKGDYDLAVKMYRTAFEQYADSPMVKDEAAEVAYYEGQMYENIGDVYASASDGDKRGKDKLRLNLKNAADNFQKTLNLWRQPEVNSKFFSKNQEQIESVQRKMASCVAKINTV